MAVYDDTAAIGKLYRRQDEIGTPWCVTVDVDSLEDGAVTVRDRDSMTQERVPVEGVTRLILDRLDAARAGSDGDRQRPGAGGRGEIAGAVRAWLDGLDDGAAVASDLPVRRRRAVRLGVHARARARASRIGDMRAGPAGRRHGDRRGHR